MKRIDKIIYLMLVLVGGWLMASCSDDNDSTLRLDGNTRIESIIVSGMEGEIDHSAKSIVVNFPVSQDLTKLSVDAITLSEGATCDYPVGTTFDGTMPRAIRVLNGNVYNTYTLYTGHDRVEFLSFKLNGEYEGVIDNTLHTINVFVPMESDVTSMVVTYEVSEGATVTPESGTVLDFSSPVEFTATLRSATEKYVVTVVKDDMSREPKAFIGNKASADQLDAEAAAAWAWMRDNVPGTTYVSLQQIIDGEVKLDDYKMVWAHLDFTDWPSQMWDTRDQFNSYWLRGGNILATRDGARYINDVWRIAKNQQSPNDIFGGDGYSTLSADLGISITGHESHALYSGIATEGGRILLVGSGCKNSGRTLQWTIGSAYSSLDDWMEKTGAVALGSGDTYDANVITVAEFEPYEALKGYTSGRVIVIGSPAYEWYDPSGNNNPYSDNRIKLTKNAINYLCQ